MHLFFFLILPLRMKSSGAKTQGRRHEPRWWRKMRKRCKCGRNKQRQAIREKRPRMLFINRQRMRPPADVKLSDGQLHAAKLSVAVHAKCGTCAAPGAAMAQTAVKAVA